MCHRQFVLFIFFVGVKLIYSINYKAIMVLVPPANITDKYRFRAKSNDMTSYLQCRMKNKKSTKSSIKTTEGTN